MHQHQQQGCLGRCPDFRIASSGRCNRFAESEAAQIYVVTCDKDWAIYGDDLNFIKSLDGDASCINLWKRREDVAKLTKVPPMIPTVEPHVLDILSMTLFIMKFLLGKSSCSMPNIKA